MTQASSSRSLGHALRIARVLGQHLEGIWASVVRVSGQHRKGVGTKVGRVLGQHCEGVGPALHVS